MPHGNEGKENRGEPRAAASSGASDGGSAGGGGGGAGTAAPRAIVIGVGEELLSGRTVDTNGAWLAGELATLGIPVHRHLAVGDAIEAIEEALLWGLTRGDVVMMTGGLGPTRDDRTRQAVARALGRPLRQDDALASSLLERSRAHGRPDPPAAYLDQAKVPEGARILKNTLGSAPGLVLEVDENVVVLLPGVPFEMKGLFRDAVVPLLARRFAATLRPVRSRSILTTGIAESVLAERVAAVLPPESDPVEVAFLPRLGDVELRLTVREGAPDEAEAWLDRVEGEVAPLVEPYRYRAESGSVVEAVAARLVASGRTVAVAESCTGGLLGARLTDRAGASGYFLGGIIAYADEVKVRELGVAPEVLEEHGAVSAQTARAMARGVARRFGSDVGLAITGIAGPGGGTAAKPVGTVWYAISVGEKAEAHEGRFHGGREQIRERSVQAALALVLGEMKVD